MLLTRRRARFVRLLSRVSFLFLSCALLGRERPAATAVVLLDVRWRGPKTGGVAYWHGFPLAVLPSLMLVSRMVTTMKNLKNTTTAAVVCSMRLENPLRALAVRLFSQMPRHWEKAQEGGGRAATATAAAESSAAVASLNAFMAHMQVREKLSCGCTVHGV